MLLTKIHTHKKKMLFYTRDREPEVRREVIMRASPTLTNRRVRG